MYFYMHDDDEGKDDDAMATASLLKAEHHFNSFFAVLVEVPRLQKRLN